MRAASTLLLAGTYSLTLIGCSSTPPEKSPPLRTLEEPLELFAEPADEAARRELPLGGFTGCSVQASGAAESLEALFADRPGAAPGLTVTRIVENSPADAAGLQVGDLLLEAGIEGAEARTLEFPSVWRELELDCQGGERLEVRFDRANRVSRTTVVVIPRVRPLERAPVQRLREEQYVGVVVRTATEVEARAAGLGPGAGAVVVGLDRNSPWRAAGIRFGDLLTGIGDQPVHHPEVVLDAIRAAEAELNVEWRRDGVAMQATTNLSRRQQELHEFNLPPLFSYESDRGRSDTSLLLGLFRYESTEAAWRMRLFWLLSFGGGDADQLLEVGR